MANSSIIDVVVPPEEQIKKDVEHLKEWMSKEPHLPKIEDEKWLTTFLYNNKFSLEKTKAKLDGYYSMRTKYPEILKNRDPTGQDLNKVRDFVKFALGPLRDGKVILFAKYTGADAFSMTNYFKRIFMLLDILMLDESTRLVQFVSIVDLKNFSPMHAVKLMTGMSAQAEITNKGYSERSKAIHLINFPSFAHTILDTMLRMFPEKRRDRIHLYTEDKSKLFEVLDKEEVCSDFGGTGPSLAELEEQTQKRLEELKWWFEEQENICSNEDLRRKDFNQVEEMRGSFRKLEVD